MNVWLVEFAWTAKSSSSDISLVPIWKTTPIIAQVIYIILFALLSQFSDALSSVAGWVNCLLWSVTSSVTHVWSHFFEEFSLIDDLVVIWVFSHLQIVVDTGLPDGQNAKGLSNISKNSSIWLFASLNIWMVSLNLHSVGLLNLFWSGGLINTKDRVILLLSWNG